MRPPEEPADTPPDGLPPILAAPPEKQHHWYRPRNVIFGTSALVAGIVVISVVAGGSEHTSSPRPHSTPSVTATSAQPVTSIPSTTPPTIEDWLLGEGYKDLTTVQADVASVSTDARAQDVTAVEQDGEQLSADAAAAALVPPPFDPEDYTAAMGEFQRAGDLMQQDDFAGATRYLDQGSVLIRKVTASIPTPGA